MVAEKYCQQIAITNQEIKDLGTNAITFKRPYGSRHNVRCREKCFGGRFMPCLGKERNQSGTFQTTEYGAYFNKLQLTTSYNL
uniref:Uncharacterized protein n=1 Tax=Vibrio cyclitrophicus TaxID=47951 RepID=A0A7Z1S4H8_9VIBR|nr:hypothetical protein BCS91_11290 [Vibrio cyclitrophicus]PMP32966.1 hypothetical protein BCS90_09530 [Vibrio cyclitrophicus]